MSVILVTGAYGQLGNELKKISRDMDDPVFVFTDADTLDITQPDSLQQFLNARPVQYIINCAAYNGVDTAEVEKDTAYLINGEAVKNMGVVAARKKIQLIHFSTDYVFDGEKNHPYSEGDPPNPVSVYGQSKLAGETSLLDLKTGIIIRTSWLYSSFGRNFVKTMLRLGKENEKVRVVNDQTGTPTYAQDLAYAVIQIIRQCEHKKTGLIHGLFHYSNSGECTWWEFAKEIMLTAGLKCKVDPIQTADYPLPAKRPFYSVLSKDKIIRTFNLNIPHWRDSLKQCINEIQLTNL